MMHPPSLLSALLIALVSLPAFITGHLLRHGSPELTQKVALLAFAVLMLASAIMARRSAG